MTMDGTEWRRRTDWFQWQGRYDQAESSLSKRLDLVQSSIREFLDAAPPGPISVVSICAGQGRDVVGALADHPRRGDVTGRLVELDERNVVAARKSLEEAGIRAVEPRTADAGVTDSYLGAVPADLVLICGVFGHLDDRNAAGLIERLPQLCAAGATVIWTRGVGAPPTLLQNLASLVRTGRWRPKRARAIPRWFRAAKFRQERVRQTRDRRYWVVTARFHGRPVPLEPGVTLFSFMGVQDPPLPLSLFGLGPVT